MERDPLISLLERPVYDHERRTRDDTETWLAEVLDGQMRTQFEYTFDGRELYGEDGSPLGPIFKTAKNDAERLAAFDPRLRFEVRRRGIESEELQDMYAMGRGELPNTMVVISDFPPELQGATKDMGGYNVRRQQTMLRVITRNPNGSVTMISQSLDRSNRQALEAIYASLGFEAQPGELLGQRMHLDLAAEDQEFLPDILTGVYDRSLVEQHGGEWYAGRTPAEMLNTYDFVRSQDDLISLFVKQKLSNPVAAEKMRYGIAATMEKRFLDRHRTGRRVTNGLVVSEPDLLAEISTAFEVAVASGKSYSGCGITLDQVGANQTNEQLEASGYGNKACVEVKNGQVVKCPDCKKFVKAIVPNKETIYCSNPSCKLAHPKVVNDYRRSKADNN